MTTDSSLVGDAGLEWLDELDLDPSSSWRSMGTRALGDRPWLSGDRSALGLRARLLDQRFDEVCAAPRSLRAAVDELVTLVGAEADLEPTDRKISAVGSAGSGRSGAGVADAGVARQLVWLGRSVAEDFCLLRRGENEWEFEGGVLCFPSRWRLADKLGQPLRSVHGPVDGYDPVLADRVTSLLDRLGERIVLRRNWFVHPDAALFQPDRPAGGDPLVPAAEVLDSLFVRSERQTLRALPRSGRVVFAIGIQQSPLEGLIRSADRRARFIDYLLHAPADQVTHRGMSPEQSAAVLAAITHR